jgi:hypothetical protein
MVISRKAGVFFTGPLSNSLKLSAVSKIVWIAMGWMGWRLAGSTHIGFCDFWRRTFGFDLLG